MAKRSKPVEDDLSLPTTDQEMLANWIADIRNELAIALAPFIEGPLSERCDDGFPMSIGKGHQWYRLRPRLDEKQTRRLNDLRQAEKDLCHVEQELEHPERIYLPRLFGCALRIGIFSERAKARIPSNRPTGGRPPVLTADDVIQIRIRRGGGRTVADLAGDYGVSDDLIYNVLNGKYVPKK